MDNLSVQIIPTDKAVYDLACAIVDHGEHSHETGTHHEWETMRGILTDTSFDFDNVSSDTLFNGLDLSQWNSSDACKFLELIETLESNKGDDDFSIEFDGNEYRVIADSAIWDIYVEAIKDIVNDCYDLKLDKLPEFLAVEIDWEQTAKNCYVDGYGHTFATYDGEEVECSDYWIFRTN